MALDLETLQQFTGTTEYHRWSILFRNLFLTDGAKYVAENASAYWLMDVIASHQPKALKNNLLRDFQVWKIVVENSKAVVSCYADSDQPPIIQQKIEYTDFPEGEFTLWVEPLGGGRYLILLPSEH